MGLFSRKSNDTPSNPQLAELGREYAIAECHRDRKAMRRITRELGSTDRSDADRASFEQGRQDYHDIPPAYSRRSNGRR
ncbi:hypothetical protein [Streptomyces pseudogriseolus]|uniref:Uncharacterized protein n=1 Tax=Streptomyces pseudogriseolus TaxID=36817 RepID=A0ABQ2SLC6_STREZ|nr:hypothetical protein [Streptomyces rubiginosus]GGS31205.1 hypothetical protein GCM10010285_07130 [Streptomyces rubiginosus]